MVLSKQKKILSLVRRREEVIKRAGMIVAGKIPDNLIFHGAMPDFIMWIIEPHVYPTFEEYKEIPNETIREMYDKKIKELINKDEEENNENES